MGNDVSARGSSVTLGRASTGRSKVAAGQRCRSRREGPRRVPGASAPRTTPTLGGLPRGGGGGCRLQGASPQVPEGRHSGPSGCEPA